MQTGAALFRAELFPLFLRRQGGCRSICGFGFQGSGGRGGKSGYGGMRGIGCNRGGGRGVDGVDGILRARLPVAPPARGMLEIISPFSAVSKGAYRPFGGRDFMRGEGDNFDSFRHGTAQGDMHAACIQHKPARKGGGAQHAHLRTRPHVEHIQAGGEGGRKMYGAHGAAPVYGQFG